MSTGADSEAVAAVTNYVPDTQPRELTEQEIDNGTEQAIDDQSQAYLAIKREDGHVGGKVTTKDASPKIRVLYTTPDGRRSFLRVYDATQGDGEHDFTGSLTAVLARDPDAGFQTAGRSIKSFRQLARDRHDLGGDDGD